MEGDVRLANAAWETLFRAQATIAREFADADTWGDMPPRDYGVLYALSSAPDGLRITELGEDVLLTQPGMSRMIVRLESRGLVERRDDPADARACRIHLTPAGAETQRRLGAAHARHITRAMGRALDHEQLKTLQDLCQALLDAAPAPHRPTTRSTERSQP